MAEVPSPRLGPKSFAVIAGLAIVEGAVRYALAHRRDRIAADHALRQALEEALLDPVTGLPNRRAADALLTAPRSDGPTALALIDLDHFKLVNDLHSHMTGDTVLAQVGQCLRANLRDTDVLARLGGDEFLVILPVTTTHDAISTLTRAAAALAALPDTYGVTASVGVAELPAGTDDPTPALLRADAAMYTAKQAGGNQVTASVTPAATAATSRATRPPCCAAPRAAAC